MWKGCLGEICTPDEGDWEPYRQSCARAEQVVVDAARRLTAGETILSASEVLELLRIAGRSRERDHEARLAIERLTPRELEVLQALADALAEKLARLRELRQEGKA